MEQIAIKNSEVIIGRAFVCDIELVSGKKSRIVCVFDSDEISFEEMNLGLNGVLKKSRGVKKSLNTLCSYINGQLVPKIQYEEVEFK
ncbi:hypothetical protein [Gaoshiqia sp. Z1-71]|uniref:hypothetical protein n=1 Tax=Gaoshiqia hydrogeniformans TaxID=3290090 RepID=UPI003BF8FA2A